VTIAEIMERTRERLEESSSSPQRYPDADLEQYIEDGARFYVARTGCYTGTQTITQAADTLFYDLSHDCIQVERVLWSSGGKYYPLTPTTARRLDTTWAHGGRWTTQQSTRSTHYFLLGLDKLALWPLSDTANSYIVHYQKDLGTSTTATDIVPIEDHEFLVHFCLARCLLAESKTDVGFAEYETYRAGVLAAAARMANADRVWSIKSGWQGIAP
jgi:hypothetical protein